MSLSRLASDSVTPSYCQS